MRCSPESANTHRSLCWPARPGRTDCHLQARAPSRFPGRNHVSLPPQSSSGWSTVVTHAVTTCTTRSARFVEMARQFILRGTERWRRRTGPWSKHPPQSLPSRRPVGAPTGGFNDDVRGNEVTMGDEQRTPNSGDTFDFAAITEAARERLVAARGLNAPIFPAETDPLPEPGINQIWRARWEKTATAVIIVANPDEDNVRVAAVTFDPDLADSSATITSAVGTTIGTPAVLWLDVTETIPLATLDTHLGDMKTPSPEHDPLDGVPALPKPPTRRRTNRVMRASVIDDLRALAVATWIPETGGDITELLAKIKNSDTRPGHRCEHRRRAQDQTWPKPTST